MSISEFIEKLRNYAAEYRKPPYGREVEGTPELLDEAADIIEELFTMKRDLQQKKEGTPKWMLESNGNAKVPTLSITIMIMLSMAMVVYIVANMPSPW